jgi:predicted nucleic acid-binding protein
VAQLIDASVFIAAERGHISYDQVTAALEGEDGALAAVTAAELLAGVQFANTAERQRRREAFVEQILQALPVVAFDLAAARTYARIAADIRRAGFTVGVHDLQIAAAALAGGYGVITVNVRDFGRVGGLAVRAVTAVDQTR